MKLRVISMLAVGAIGLAVRGAGHQLSLTTGLPGCSSAACKTDYRLLLARTALPGNSPMREEPDTSCPQQIVKIGLAAQLRLYPGGTGATFRTACLLAVKKADQG